MADRRAARMDRIAQRSPIRGGATHNIDSLFVIDVRETKDLPEELPGDRLGKRLKYDERLKVLTADLP
ncbi:hypothetical protein J6590_069157 [Homalodisca vitripennis]|nr:hypothetical protein J6590_069157 [Homalodisca vitripennis]